MYRIEELIESVKMNAACINGRYVPSRPIPFESWVMRLRDAWEVLTGRADAVRWTGQ